MEPDTFDEYFDEVLAELADLIGVQSPDLCMDEVYPLYVAGKTTAEAANIIYCER